MKNVQKVVKRVSSTYLTVGFIAAAVLIAACSEYDANGLHMMRGQGAPECHDDSGSGGLFPENDSPENDPPGNGLLLEVVETGDLQRLGELIAGGIHVNACDNTGWTALMHAVMHGNEDCVIALINAGADVGNVDDFGNTALLIAARDNKETCLLALIEARANVDAADKAGNTALMHAAMHKNAACVRILLEAGANVNAVNRYRKTAFMLSSNVACNEACINALREAEDIYRNIESGNIGSSSTDTE